MSLFCPFNDKDKTRETDKLTNTLSVLPHGDQPTLTLFLTALVLITFLCISGER